MINCKYCIVFLLNRYFTLFNSRELLDQTNLSFSFALLKELLFYMMLPTDQNKQ